MFRRARKPRVKLTPAMQQTVEIALAVARESILVAHTAYAQEAIELGHGQVSALRVLRAYLRLHRIEETDATIVGNRVLAALGRKSRRAAAPAEPPEDEVWDPDVSTIGYLRTRFRGRVHHELRRQLELHTGRTGVRLLHLHVEHALGLVAILSPDVPIRAVVDLYCAGLKVAPSVGEMVYAFVLDRLGTAELPATQAALESIIAPGRAPLANGSDDSGTRPAQWRFGGARKRAI